VKNCITGVFCNKLLRIKLYSFPLKDKKLSGAKEQYLFSKVQISFCENIG